MVGSLKVLGFVKRVLCILAFSTATLHCAPWLPFGPDGGDARRIAADPINHTHLYLGAANGWIYESRNAGASWIRLAQIGSRDDLILDSIAVDRTDPNHLLVGAWVVDHPDGGLFLSNDGGHTWQNQAEMRGQSVRALAVSPSDPKSFVAGTLQGVFRSVDSGQHWARISPPDNAEIHEVQSVAVDPKDSNIIYAGTWHLPWKTMDGGEHWSSMKQGIIDDSDVFSIIVDPLSPQIVYASACSGIYKSDDAGTLFHKVQGIPSTARRTRVLLQDPHHLERVFAGTTEGLFRTEDSGKTWNRTTGPEIIVNDVLVDLADPRHVLLATNRGGVMASDDGGDTFHSSNGGFSARQITALQRDFKHSNTLFVGVVNDKDWGGVFASENEGVNWMQRSEGLQGRDVFSLGQAPDGTMIAGTAHGIYRYDPLASLWQRVENTPFAAVAEEAGPSPKLVRPAAPSGHKLTGQGIVNNSRAGADRHRASHPAKPLFPRALHRPSAQGLRSSSTFKASSGKQIKSQSGAARHLAPPAHPARSVVATLPVRPTKTTESASTPFDGPVYSLITSGNAVLAATPIGLLSSVDNGLSWTATGPHESADWRLLATAKRNVVAASLRAVQFSPDSGITWSPIKLPQDLTQVTAVAVESSGVIWLGSREGVFVTSDAGNTWTTPKDLYANSVSSIFYDESHRAITVTTAGGRGTVYTVQLPQKTISYFQAGWTLRFAQPAGDHLIAATLFDGLVVQPRMMASPAPDHGPPATPPPSTSTAHP